MFNFMGLPRELRDEVYKLCLTVGAEIVAYPSRFQAPTDFTADGVSRPTVALLRVNKQIGGEAAIVLYGENVWRLQGLLLLFDKRFHRMFWEHGHELRHLTLTLDRRDMKPLDSEFLHEIHTWTPQELGSRTPSEFIHDIQLEHLRNAIELIQEDLADHMKNIQSLTLKVDELFCVNGCCRSSLVEYVFDNSRMWSTSTTSAHPGIAVASNFPRLKKLQVTGIVTDEEKTIVKEAWGIDPVMLSLRHWS